VDVASLRCDYLAATARKFLRGPRGIGFLYVSDAVLESGAAPLLTDLRAATWTAADRMQLAPDAKRFENWESSHALVLGLGAAVRYALEQGVEFSGARARMLADRLRDRAADVSGVSVVDRGSVRSAIVSLALRDLDPYAVVLALRPRGIHVWSIPREHAIFDMDQKRLTTVLRVSPHYYNTEEELDTFVAALREMTTSPSARAPSS
jgi:selenocysteine lyase/cysteine desulfurase